MTQRASASSWTLVALLLSTTAFTSVFAVGTTYTFTHLTPLSVPVGGNTLVRAFGNFNSRPISITVNGNLSANILSASETEILFSTPRCDSCVGQAVSLAMSDDSGPVDMQITESLVPHQNATTAFFYTHFQTIPVYHAAQSAGEMHALDLDSILVTTGYIPFEGTVYTLMHYARASGSSHSLTYTGLGGGNVTGDVIYGAPVSSGQFVYIPMSFSSNMHQLFLVAQRPSAFGQPAASVALAITIHEYVESNCPNAANAITPGTSTSLPTINRSPSPLSVVQVAPMQFRFSMQVPYLQYPYIHVLDFAPYDQHAGLLSHWNSLTKCASIPTFTTGDNLNSTFYYPSLFETDSTAQPSVDGEPSINGRYLPYRTGFSHAESGTPSKWKISVVSCDTIEYSVTLNLADLLACTTSSGGQALTVTDTGSEILINGTVYYNVIAPPLSATTLLPEVETSSIAYYVQSQSNGFGLVIQKQVMSTLVFPSSVSASLSISQASIDGQGNLNIGFTGDVYSSNGYIVNSGAIDAQTGVVSPASFVCNVTNTCRAGESKCSYVVPCSAAHWVADNNGYYYVTISIRENDGTVDQLHAFFHLAMDSTNQVTVFVSTTAPLTVYDNAADLENRNLPAEGKQFSAGLSSWLVGTDLVVNPGSGNERLFKGYINQLYICSLPPGLPSLPAAGCTDRAIPSQYRYSLWLSNSSSTPGVYAAAGTSRATYPLSLVSGYGRLDEIQFNPQFLLSDPTHNTRWFLHADIIISPTSASGGARRRRALTASTAPTMPITSTQQLDVLASSESPSSSGSNTAAIVGPIAAVGGVALFCGIFFVAYRRRQQKKREQENGALEPRYDGAEMSAVGRSSA